MSTVTLCDGCGHRIPDSTPGTREYKYALSMEQMPSRGGYTYTMYFSEPHDPSGEYCSIDCLLTKVEPERLDTTIPTM